MSAVDVRRLSGSAQPHRLQRRSDRSRRGRCAVHFDGQAIDGFAGDTLASALLANGIRLVGRSFKYHRPRGILTAGPEEPNALVELRSGARREPNTSATTIELFDGLEADEPESLAVAALRPALGQFAARAVLLGRLLLQDLHVAGLVLGARLRAADPPRRRAWAAPPGSADPDHYEQAYAFCDVLIDRRRRRPDWRQRSRPARAGARVILCEEDFSLGGRLLADDREIDGSPGSAWAADDCRRTARPAQRAPDAAHQRVRRL